MIEDAFVRSMVALRLHRVMIDERAVYKERTAGAASVILAGNAYFRLCGAPLRMFVSRAAWIERERVAWRTLYGVTLASRGRALVMPRLEGQDLRACVDDEPLIERALTAAGRALSAAHSEGLSHADANLGNFIFDGRVARMIDFDAVHVGALPMPTRALDDLLSLALDLACREGDLRARVASVIEGYRARGSLPSAALGFVAEDRWLSRTLLRARAFGASYERARAARSTLAALLKRRV